MTPQLWAIVVLLLAIIGLLFLVGHLLDKMDAKEREYATQIQRKRLHRVEGGFEQP